MKRSTKDLVGAQLAGLAFAVIVFATFLISAPASPAVLTGSPGCAYIPIDRVTPEVSYCYSSQDGTFDVEAYLIFQAACRTMGMCLGIPLGARSLQGVQILYHDGDTETACVLPSVQTSDLRVRGREHSTGALLSPVSEPVKSRTSRRSGSR